MSRILVVDDNEVNRALVQAVLGRDGHNVIPARDGQEALASAALQPPDLVISDLLMPVMDGYTLLRHWKADERLRRIPFVIYTGTYTEPQDQQLAENLGADAYLRKPLEPGHLCAEIDAVLARKVATSARAREPIADEGEQMAGYSRVLVRKLEEKTERVEKANRELEEANARLRQLSQRVLEVQEAERAAIARELHDEIGQALTAIKLDAQSLAERAAGPDAQRLRRCVSIVDATLAQVRSLALELRPPHLDQIGLPAALRDLTDRMAASAAIDGRFESSAEDVAPGPDLATTAFRVVQEALTNVVRHAKASGVTVELGQRDGELTLAVSDDGRGFDVEAAERHARRGASLGLLGMRERATLAGGWLRLRSSPGQGTRVEAGFPMPQARRGAG
jgi:signal transduction histidine kinase